MGVTKLWNVLKQTKEDITLEDIRGKTLAVDLAAWICELESVKQTHSYLRNLFFRLSGVIKADITLVFVLDGKPPELKWETISKRLASTSGEMRKPSSGIRSRLNAKLKECCVLFDSLGVPWIKAEGEAEALCATLNKVGLVDGVVTNDGDAFLYGAQTVYRNFSLEQSVPIEKYCMKNIERILRMNQRELIALGLLLGCDYCPKGVAGVGEAQAIKLQSSFQGQDSLHVFSLWRKTGRSVNTYKSQHKPVHCSSCGHEGTKKEHSRDYCGTCGRECRNSTVDSTKKISCICDWHREEEDRKKFALEEKIRTTAMKDPSFPDKAIINEFLKSQRYVNSRETRTLDSDDVIVCLKKKFILTSPKINHACKYLKQKVDWKLPYAIDKVLPLVTHFLLCSSNTEETLSAVQIYLNSVIKKRVKDQVQSLEVEWKLYEKLDVESDCDVELVTIEPEESLVRMYPDIVLKFYERIQNEKEDKKKVKAEAKREERKKKGITSKSDIGQTKKMTDYFKTKKLRNENKKEDKFERSSATIQDLAILEASLSHLSLSKEVSKNKKSLPPASNKSKRYNNDSNKMQQENECKDLLVHRDPSHQILIFSSDSENDDLEVENLLGKMGAISLGSKGNNSQMRCVEKITSKDSKLSRKNLVENSEYTHPSIVNETSDFSLEDDITFSNELDFSLGCSLLRTPIICKDKENNDPFPLILCSPALKDPIHKNSSTSNNLNEHAALHKLDLNRLYSKKSEIQSIKTSDRRLSPTRMPQSPVFMTLMERLKARQKK